MPMSSLKFRLERAKTINSVTNRPVFRPRMWTLRNDSPDHGSTDMGRPDDQNCGE